MKHFILGLVLLTLVCSGCNIATKAADSKAIEPKKFTENGKDIEIDDYGCRIERYTIHSDKMDKEVEIAVVLPPGYDQNPDKKYPIVYTLHGARAPYDTFANMSRFRKALVEKPMIYTCFEAKLSSYYDFPNDPKIQYTTFFFDEFIPYIDANYRTNGQRGVGGFSMGGTGSMHYTFQHPEMFTATCVLSSGFARHDDKNSYSRRGSRFGDYETNKDFYISIDKYAQLEKYFNAGTKLPVFMFRCGTEDGAVKRLRQYRDFVIELNGKKRKEIYDSLEGDNGSQKSKQVDKLMETQGIQFTYVESPGRHAWPYWHGQAPEFARFFWEAFQKEKAQQEKK